MKLNKFIFSEEYAYTLDEVWKKLKNTEYSNSPLTNIDICIILQGMGLLVLSGSTTIIANPFNYSFLKTGAISDNVSKNARDVLNKVYLRYKNHYAIVLDTDEETSFYKKAQEFFIQMCNVLDYTFEKYDTLLGIYESQKSHLLDKLQRIRDEDKTHSENENHYIRKGTNISTENESGSQVAGSKTPQTINTTGNFDALNGYWDNFDKAHESGTSSSTGSETDDGSSSRSGSEGVDATESFDPTTMMARIDEIQKQYENTMFKWVEEFDRLFIEEGNI